MQGGLVDAQRGQNARMFLCHGGQPGNWLGAGQYPVRRNARHHAQAQKNRLQEEHPLLGDHAQQPSDVVPRSAQHRVQSVAGFALEVADDRFYRLTPLEQPSVLLTDLLGLAPVHDVHT